MGRGQLFEGALLRLLLSSLFKVDISWGQIVILFVSGYEKYLSSFLNKRECFQGFAVVNVNSIMVTKPYLLRPHNLFVCKIYLRHQTPCLESLLWTNAYFNCYPEQHPFLVQT